MINKVCSSVSEGVAEIPDGATVMIGGFGAAGSPIELIHALIDQGATGLTVINNNTGNGEVGLAALIGNGQVKKMICSFPKSSQSKVFPTFYQAGKIELDDIILVWGGWERTLDIRVLGITARNRGGSVIAAAPEVSVSLAVVALTRGEISLTRFELIEPLMLAHRTKSGEFEIAIGERTGPTADTLPLAGHHPARRALPSTTSDPSEYAISALGGTQFS